IEIWSFGVAKTPPQKPIYTISLPGVDAVLSIAFSADGKYLAAGTSNKIGGQAMVFQTGGEGQALGSTAGGAGTGFVSGVAFNSTNSNELLIGTQGAGPKNTTTSYSVFDIKQGKVIRSSNIPAPANSNGFSIESVSANPQNAEIAIAGGFGKVLI